MPAHLTRVLETAELAPNSKHAECPETGMNSPNHAMQRHQLRQFILSGVIAFWLAVSSTAFGQAITSSAVSGMIADETGKPIPNAIITILHEPSGTRVTTQSRSNGQYNASGLRVGGPYRIEASAGTYKPQAETNVYLELGQTAEVNIRLGADVVRMEAFRVEGERDSVFGSGKTGAGTTMSDREIDEVATVRRSIQDMARLDPRIIVQSLDQGGEMSAQGQNSRFNSFLIDGVQANDPFGLNSNGYSSLRSPVPLEAIQALNVELAPFDVRFSGFSGALINAIVRSGTNQFHGSVSYQITDENMRAKNPVSGVRDLFDEKTWTVTFGGPIIRNKLFFFLSWDDFTRTTTPPNQNFLMNSADLQAIATRAKTLGYEVGDFSAANEEYQESFLAKVDWNITDQHRLSATYRKIEGQQTSFASYSSSTLTSFSNYWYDTPRTSESWVGKLNSTWTPDLRTEISFSTNDYDGSPKNHGSPFPEVTINGLSGTRRDTGASITNGGVRLGTEYSRQRNAITTKTKTLAGNAEWSMGDHTFVAGSDYENRSIVNDYIQAFYGSYAFPNLAAWQSGQASSFTRAILAPGKTLDDATARFDVGMLGIFVQDTWKPNDSLTLSAGLRLDQQLLPDKPTTIPDGGTYSEAAFRQQFGMDSTGSPDGEYAIGPRIGFRWEPKNFTRKTTFRGGFGMFQGRNPVVWLSNAYSNRGVVATQSAPSGTTTPFNPNVTTGTGLGGIPRINLTDSNFKQPLNWKSSVAIDHQMPMKDWVMTLELGRIDTYKAPLIQNINLKKTGTMPDGRDLYAGVVTPTNSATSRGGNNSNVYRDSSMYQYANFTDVYYLTNTEKGGGYDASIMLKREFKNKWSASLAYTFSHYGEVTPLTSSTAHSLYNTRAVYNPNEDVSSTSNYEITGRFIAQLTRQFEFIKKAPTTISVLFEARSGRPYSWVFNGDANGDGYSENDLLYVPTGPNDPKVTWANNSERDAFFAFVDSSALAKYKGTVAPRNSERSPWVYTADLRFVQRIPIYKTVTTDLFVNIINFANLIDDKWGIQEEVPFSYKRSIAGTTFNPTTKQYGYSFNGGTFDGVPVTANDTPTSRWQVQMGIRVRF